MQVHRRRVGREPRSQIRDTGRLLQGSHTGGVGRWQDPTRHHWIVRKSAASIPGRRPTTPALRMCGQNSFYLLCVSSLVGSAGRCLWAAAALLTTAQFRMSSGCLTVIVCSVCKQHGAHWNNTGQYGHLRTAN